MIRLISITLLLPRSDGLSRLASVSEDRPATTIGRWAHEPKTSGKVLYSIQSGQNTLPRLDACLSTWASALPKDQLQVIGVAAPLNETIRKMARWHATTCPDTHDAGACKDAYALATAFKTHADWVVLIGDDNYVVTDNFAEILTGYNASEPMVLGIVGCGDCKAGGLCGGGGQVFSRGALKQFMKNGKDSFLEEEKVEAEACGMWGDVANCRVASNHDVPVRSLLGLHGWEEHGSVLESSIHSKEPKPLTFHYVGASEMKALHEQVLMQDEQVLVGRTRIGTTVALAGKGVSPEYKQAWDEYVKGENKKRKESKAA